MTLVDPLVVIHCPVCDASGAVLRHDARATLVYSCEICLHEWEQGPSRALPAAKSAPSGTSCALEASRQEALARKP